MKVNRLLILLTLWLCGFCLNSHAAIIKTVWPDAAAVQYVFIENSSDNNYFVTAGTILDPRMTGANSWTGLKYTGTGTIYQQSLGYIDNGYNTGLTANYMFDMWLDNPPVSGPFTGLRCINWYAGCNMNTSLILPPSTDNKGFYGVTVPTGGQMWMHGMMSDAFYQYLQQRPVGSSFTMSMNGCMTSVKYNATTGARCKDQSSGYWYTRNVTQTKAAHMKLVNTNSMSEIFIDSNGVPTIGEGNTDCKVQTVGAVSGLSCKMVTYTLQNNGLSNTTIHVFPAISNSTLSSAIGLYDMQFSLDRNSWQPVSGTAYYYTFDQLKSKNAIYVFFSNNFFKQLVAKGLSDINTQSLFNFRFQNTLSAESGWYEFSSSNGFIIKPRNFSISIISSDYSMSPTLSGNVGASEPSLNFDYIVTTSGKTAADQVSVKVTGPTQTVGGKAYCIFSSPDALTKVPFPGLLIMTTSTGTQRSYNAGCDGIWHDMTDALWLSTPWTDTNGGVGVMNKTTLTFSIPMKDPVSLRTVGNTDWFGTVSASGEINVQATWKNIK